MIIWGDLIFNNMLSEINDNAILAKYSNENMKKKVKSAILISGESINVTIYDNLYGTYYKVAQKSLTLLNVQ